MDALANYSGGESDEEEMRTEEKKESKGSKPQDTKSPRKKRPSPESSSESNSESSDESEEEENGRAKKEPNRGQAKKDDRDARDEKGSDVDMDEEEEEDALNELRNPADVSSEGMKSSDTKIKKDGHSRNRGPEGRRRVSSSGHEERRKDRRDDDDRRHGKHKRGDRDRSKRDHGSRSGRGRKHGHGRRSRSRSRDRRRRRHDDDRRRDDRRHRDKRRKRSRDRRRRSYSKSGSSSSSRSRSRDRGHHFKSGQEKRIEKISKLGMAAISVGDPITGEAKDGTPMTGEDLNNAIAAAAQAAATLAKQAAAASPQAAMEAAVREMHKKVENETGIAVPKFYNPTAVNPMKYAEQVQKRKLLWGKKDKEEPKTSCLDTWKGATFDNDSKSEKFRKLMGLKGDAGAEQGESSTSSDVKEKQEELYKNLERQYELSRMQTHTGNRIGFGSSSLPPP